MADASARQPSVQGLRDQTFTGKRGLSVAGVSSPVAPAGLPGASASGALHQPWTEEDLQVLRQRYGAESCRRIGERLGRGPESVRSMARRLGLTSGARSTPRYSLEDNALIRDLAATHSYREIGEILGRSTASIEKHANRIGVFKVYQRKRKQPAPKKVSAPKQPKPPKRAPPVDVDVQRTVVTLEPLGPGYGPRTIHRIGL